jgi:hypothetical protein
VQSKADRRRLLLHRLFENRINASTDNIEPAIAINLAEHLRLKEIVPAEHERWRQDYLECWPFSPQLIQLLEDQILVATQAQDTRDLIRILASLFKARGKKMPILTAADFNIEDDDAGISALIDSVANDQHKTLRSKAVRNLEAVRDAVTDYANVLPDLNDIMAALWVRSISVGNQPGADARTLQVDCTRAKSLDDNLFNTEMLSIVENSFNIHHRGAVYQFKEEENPRARLMATARNDRQFVDGRDLQHLAKEIRYAVMPGKILKRFASPDDLQVGRRQTVLTMMFQKLLKLAHVLQDFTTHFGPAYAGGVLQPLPADMNDIIFDLFGTKFALALRLV